MSKPIFISHASADKPLVSAFVDKILSNGCEVPVSKIFCTSLEGLKIPAGTASFIDFIRAQTQDPKLVILMLSPNYFASQFCLCELGACWGMGLAVFPLVIPPLKSAEIKATLAVTQSGKITDADYLDELRDVLAETLQHKVPTARWNTSRKAFIESVDSIIADLPPAAIVSQITHSKVLNDYQEAVGELSARDSKIKKLREQIAALEKLKNAPEVVKVKAQFTEGLVELQNQIGKVQAALGKLESATPYVIYCKTRGTGAEFSSRSDRTTISKALEANEIYDDEPFFKPNLNKKKVRVAWDAVEGLQSFLSDDGNADAIKAFEANNSKEIDLEDFHCWRVLFLISDPRD